MQQTVEDDGAATTNAAAAAVADADAEADNAVGLGEMPSEKEQTETEAASGVPAERDDGAEVPSPLTSASGLPLTAVKSTSSKWTDDVMALDWTQLMTVRQLRLLRDFFVEGMTVNVVEEKVQ